MSAEEVFGLILLGVLGIYWELLWPGRVLPGVVGLVMAAAGIVELFRTPVLSGGGLTLVGVAGALFVCEAFWRIDFVAGVAGTIALCLGSTFFLQNPGGIPPYLGISASIVFGAGTIFLCWNAKRARRNKWSDLA